MVSPRSCLTVPFASTDLGRPRHGSSPHLCVKWHPQKSNVPGLAGQVGRLVHREHSTMAAGRCPTPRQWDTEGENRAPARLWLVRPQLFASRVFSMKRKGALRSLAAACARVGVEATGLPLDSAKH